MHLHPNSIDTTFDNTDNDNDAYGAALALPLGWEVAQALWRGRVAVHLGTRETIAVHGDMIQSTVATTKKLINCQTHILGLISQVKIGLPEVLAGLDTALRNIDIAACVIHDVESLLDNGLEQSFHYRQTSARAAIEASRSNSWAPHSTVSPDRPQFPSLSDIQSAVPSRRRVSHSDEALAKMEPVFDEHDMAKLDYFLRDDEDEK